MYTLEFLLKEAINRKASDLHIKVDTVPIFRVCGELLGFGDKKISLDEVKIMTKEILKENYSKYEYKGEYDISYELRNVGRFRINVFKERSRDAISIRIIKNKIIPLDKLSFSNTISEFSNEISGLILVTGPTGSGKSTTIASIVEEINKNRACHIITLEEPIEYIYSQKKSIICQREIGKDTKGYEEGLKSALREDVDVILVGEMRDINTIKIAITAAETGHLVLSTLHTLGACETVDRIISVFPKEQQEEIRIQLASVLRGVIWQKLINRKDGKERCAAMEIMRVVPAIKKLIREGKTFQIQSLIQTGAKYGMTTIDRYIWELFKKGEISKDEAINKCINKDLFEKNML